MKNIFPGAIFLLGTSFYTTSSWGKGIVSYSHFIFFMVTFLQKVSDPEEKLGNPIFLTNQNASGTN